jgi:hypothetical protein
MAYKNGIESVFNFLFAGKTIKLPFNSKRESENFRIALYRYKSVQETVLLATNAIEECSSLSYSLQSDMQDIIGYPFEATIQLTKKRRLKEYIFKIVDEDDGNDSYDNIVDDNDDPWIESEIES